MNAVIRSVFSLLDLSPREDAGGWIKERYLVSIKVCGKNQSRLLPVQEAIRLLETWKRRMAGLGRIWRRIIPPFLE